MNADAKVWARTFSEAFVTTLVFFCTRRFKTGVLYKPKIAFF